MTTAPSEIRGLYEGAKCANSHKLEIVSEGYAVCVTMEYGPKWPELWAAWTFTKPALKDFYRFWIIGNDGQDIEAWVSKSFYPSKEEALAIIQDDIDAHRSRPFDEATERARLMAV